MSSTDENKDSYEAPVVEEVPLHPATAKLLGFFKYDHLPLHLQAVSKPYCDMALTLVRGLPQNAEATVALRKLLESKDCAVRAAMFP